jgi:hypothetical protein
MPERQVTAWEVTNALPDMPGPPIPYPWDSPECLVDRDHGYPGSPAAGLVWVEFYRPPRWVPMCAHGVTNYQRNRAPVAIPATVEREKDSMSTSTSSSPGYRDDGTEAGIVLVYEHPQGGTIKVFPDGSMDARNWQGKRKSTSADPVKLMNGHGQWTLTDRLVHAEPTP